MGTTYEIVARANDDILFAHCGAAACQEKFSVQAGTVVLFKKFDEGRVDLATFDENQLSEFVKANSAPITMPFDEKCAQMIFGKNVAGLFLYRDKNSEKSAALEAAVKAAAVQLKKNTMAGEISEANIMAFVDEWINGKLQATLKSEEIPAEQKDAVYTLVGKSHDTIVMDATKDVLVEYYAPWCGHCKTLAPILEELAGALKHNTNLVIAKMDSTANECDSVSVKGFPTLKFFPANKKDAPMDFSGDRTVAGFTKFLTEHSTNAVKAKEDL